MGTVRKDRGDRWYIDLPWQGSRCRIYVDKRHINFDSKRQAERCLAQIQGEIENGNFDPDFYSTRRKSIRSFNSYAQEWLCNCELRRQRGDLAAGYVRRLKGIYDNYWKPFFGESDIGVLRGKDISRFYLQLGGQAPKTRINIMGALHALFRQAWQDEVIPQMPRFPKLEKVPKRETPWVTEEQQNVILGFLDDRSRYIIEFCVRHGVRTGEARALQHGDIDLERGTVTIRRAFSGKELRPYPKGKRDRVLPLDSGWRETYLAQDRGLPAGFVFVGRTGRPHNHSYCLQHWTKACKAAGIKHCTLHQGTRHSRLTQLALAGVPGKFLQMFAGHENERTTAGYVHMNDVEALRMVIQQATGKVIQLKRERDTG